MAEVSCGTSDALKAMREQIFPLLPKGCNNASLTLDNALILAYKAVVILSWAAEFIAVFLLIYAAMLYFTAAGEEGKMAQAKKIVIAVVIGILIILLARWFLYYVTSILAASGQANLIEINNLTK